MVKPTTFRATTEDLEEKIDAKVEELGISKNQYINQALELYTGLDKKFFKALNGLAADLNITPADLIQRRFARWFGKVDAFVEIYNTYEFLKDTSSAGDFESDYLFFKKTEVEKLEKEIVEHAYKLEIHGAELEDYQKRLMIKYRMGNAWLESDEYKREVEMAKYIEEKFPDLEKRQREGEEREKAELKATKEREAAKEE